MLPTEQFSGDAVEDKSPWTPQVWRDGPDKLVAEAQSILFEDQRHFSSVLQGGDRAMAGSTQAPQNESDVLIPAGTNKSRSSNWNNELSQLRNNEPIVWQNAGPSGGINPAP